ncbi:hypothetical protein CH373_09870 [Leptospira perolatii]|uniref:6-hydroxymethylpterin diphosphokinase MptE-like domain-containing protein n=1 Tax=Leptospira perolatii TaxID=2023191 RepID=A0A2M9ZML9_9LEPT|nr:6-hydroxymethylpterin diphosphokinase MptE-like protein [Leptospira perolatii]PJZ70089.1 hypothetical protein CH360_07615 [Leptospira perolatii]PJZ73277.1 hypothetical protein CH373_09870 [Leptospira perolatii]
MIVVGIGCGYHLFAFQKQSDLKQNLICLEPFSEFETLTGEFVKTRCDSKDWKFYYGWKEFLTKPKTEWLSPHIRSIRVTVHPTYSRKFPELASEILSYFRNLDFSEKPLTVKERFSRIWVRNYFRHLRIFFENPKNFRLIGAKKTRMDGVACFVGASPSLEKEIHWLKKYSKNIFILSSDTSLSFLVSQGISPDAVLTIDSGLGTSYHFRESASKEVPIITWFGGSAYVFDLPNPKWIYLSTHPLDQIAGATFFKGTESLTNPSKNMAGMAFSVLHSLGFEKVFTLGLDFERENGKTHCRGTGYEIFDLFYLSRVTSLFSRRYTQTAHWEKRKPILEILRSQPQFPVQSGLPELDPKLMKVKLYDSLSDFPSKLPSDPKEWLKISDTIPDFPPEIKRTMQKESRILIQSGDLPILGSNSSY